MSFADFILYQHPGGGGGGTPIYGINGDVRPDRFLGIFVSNRVIDFFTVLSRIAFLGKCLSINIPMCLHTELDVRPSAAETFSQAN